MEGRYESSREESPDSTDVKSTLLNKGSAASTFEDAGYVTAKGYSLSCTGRLKGPLKELHITLLLF